MARVVAVLCATVLVQSFASEVEEALGADDHCSAGAEECALNALQMRASKLHLKEEPVDTLGSEFYPLGGAPVSCSVVGCSGFNARNPCQCNDQCGKHGNCCSDYQAVCGVSIGKPEKATTSRSTSLTSTTTFSTGAFDASAAASACAGTLVNYTLSWQAQGATFFDDFTFMLEDEMHGANQFLGKAEALAAGIISAQDTGVRIATGKVVEGVKRQSVNIHTNKAWDPNVGFLVALKFSHMPWGAGVWPSFWAVNSDVLWPGGGELDIMEYANDERNKVTFHTSQSCWLDYPKMASCSNALGLGQNGATNCATDYFQNLMGCRPRQKRFSGQQWASMPGVLAAQWSPEHIKVFLIPEAEIPDDLASGTPTPETWDKWIISYMPFEGGCPTRPQEFVFSLGLCGDWAGGAWGGSPMAKETGFVHKTNCKVNIWEPENDCCTKFVTSSGADDYLKSRAFFDLDYLKVFVPSSQADSVSVSSTFKRGGIPLKA